VLLYYENHVFRIEGQSSIISCLVNTFFSDNSQWLLEGEMPWASAWRCNFFFDCRQLVEQPQLLHAGHERVCCAQLQEPHDYSSGGVLGVRLILFHCAATDGCWVNHVIRTSKLLGLILNRLIYNPIVWLCGQEATWGLK